MIKDKILLGIVLCSFLLGFCMHGLIGSNNINRFYGTLVQDFDMSGNTINISSEAYEHITYSAEIYDNEQAMCFELDDGVLKPAKTDMKMSDGMGVGFSCSPQSVLSIHTHPNGVCAHSKKDIEKFLNTTHLYSGVACAYNKTLIINKDLETVEVKLANED